jgi:hypothetical protein
LARRGSRLWLLAGGPALAVGVPKHEAPIPAATLALMAAKDTGRRPRS